MNRFHCGGPDRFAHYTLYPQKNIKTPDVAKMVSRSWNELSPEERAPWEEKARKDKARFELEKSMYSGPWKVPAVKDPKAPKRPVSAFLCFSKARRPEVKKQGPHMSTTQISAVLARMWREAPEEERQKYVNLDLKDRERYRRELEEYNEMASKGRKKREELAFQALSGDTAVIDILSAAQDEVESELSEEGLMQDLMNRPLLAESREMQPATGTSPDRSISGDSNEKMELNLDDFGGKIEGEIEGGEVVLACKNDEYRRCSTPESQFEDELVNNRHVETGAPGLFWEPLPLSNTPREDTPISIEVKSSQEEMFQTSIVTPPQAPPRELGDNPTSSSLFGHRAHNMGRSGSYSTPLAPTPWHPTKASLKEDGYTSSRFESYHDSGYDDFGTMNYHQRNSSPWDRVSYGHSNVDIGGVPSSFGHGQSATRNYPYHEQLHRNTQHYR